MADTPLPAVLRPTFRAVGAVCVPDLAHADEATWAAVEGIVGAQLAARPAAERRAFLWFLRALPLLLTLAGRRRLAAQLPAERAAALRRLADGPVALVRRGVWGLRALVIVGAYGRPSVGRELGWHPDARGWDAPQVTTRRDARRGSPREPAGDPARATEATGGEARRLRLLS